MRRSPLMTLPAAGVAAAVVLFGAGTVLPRKAVSAQALPPPLPPGVVSYDELAGTFGSNEALADEKFLGKQVTVHGRLWGIHRMLVAAPGGGFGKRIAAYEMVLGPEHVDAAGFTLTSIPFSEEKRHALAQLTTGWPVTIRGVVDRFVRGDKPVLHFRDTELIGQDPLPKPDDRFRGFGDPLNRPKDR